MEKLYAIKRDAAYDLIILDTPPTSNALDFLDAPERMIDALDSAVMRWFVARSKSPASSQLQPSGAARPPWCCGPSVGSPGAGFSRRWPSSSRS